MFIFLATVFGLQMWNGVGMTKTVWLTRPKILTLWSSTEKKNVLILVLGEELNPTVVSSGGGGEETSVRQTHRLRDLF